MPALVVSSKVPTTVAATGGYQANDGTGGTTGAYPLGAGIVGTLATCCDASCSSTTCPEDIGALYLDKQLAFTVREGAQPDGSIKLSYECEARTQKLDVVNLVAGSDSAKLWGLRDDIYVGDWIRVGGATDAYVQIDAIFDRDELAYPYANVSLSAPWTGSTADATDAEVGTFYSDPTLASGVSQACSVDRVRETSVIPVDSSAATFSSSLRAVPTIESAANLLAVSDPGAVWMNKTHVGLEVEVTFLGQPGDLKPMRCDTAFMSSSAAGQSTSDLICNVTTLQDGSLADGDFALSTRFPNERVKKPKLYNTTAIRWNEEAARLEKILERVQADDGASKAFGLVDVARTPYVPSTETRWAGGYAWTVTFLSAVGNVPQMGVEANTTVTYGTSGLGLNPLAPPHPDVGKSAVVVEVEDENSGAADTFQGVSDSFTFAQDSTGEARDGGQVGGTYGLCLGDLCSAQNNLPVINTSHYTALTAAEFKELFEAELFAGRDVVDVARSGSPNRAAGYSYSITYRSAEVGGDVPLLTATSTLLQGPGAAATAVTDLEGAQLYGSFQLRFGGYTTGMLATDASAQDVENQLNMLSSISPSKVKVSRSGPMTTGPDLSGGTQVGGYVWSITFDSASWRDPTVVHADDGSMAGNWVGEATTWTDTWATGVSKEWGKNCGDMPPISCVDSGMYSSSGALPADACGVAEYVKGTEPLGGSFRVTLDTTGHDIINMRGRYTSDPIRHNAQAGVLESGGDGTSVEEILEKMPNVGDVLVTRSPVNEGANNGGHTWTVTFLRDAGASGEGRFGDCEQRDTVEDRCNSPGDVPKFGGFDASELAGDCSTGSGGAAYDCQKVTLLDVADKWTAPPGRDEVQSFAVRDPEYAGWGSNASSYHAAKAWTDRDDFARASYRIGFAGEFFEDCLPYDATDAQVRHALARIGKASARAFVRRALANVSVSRHFSETEAPNAWQYRVSFRGAGDVAPPESADGLQFNYTAKGSGANADRFRHYQKGGCNPFETDLQNVTARTEVDGRTNPNNCTFSGCVDGVVTRGNLTRFHVGGDDPKGSLSALGDDPLGASRLQWNAPGEGAGSVKQWLETTSLGRRVVNVSREVYGRHGVVEWRVTFVYNHEQVPPGSGDVVDLNVTQDPATNGVVYVPTVWETTKGSEGMSGAFEIDFEAPFGARSVAYNESAKRFERKLEEMLTVGGVAVERLPYPSAASGGWGDVAVAPEGERGGLEWRVKFTKNPGAYRGFTFPPGAGNLDSITVDGHGLQGNVPQVVNTVLRSGSTPFAGAFALGVRGAWSEPMEWQEAHDEMEYVLEQMDTVGELRVARSDVALQRVEGVWATVDRDGATASLRYDGTFGAGGTLETVLADALNPGEVFRLGGDRGGFAARGAAADGATRLGSLLAYKEDSPVVGTPQASLVRTAPTGAFVRVGGETHEVIRSGAEVQRLYVAADVTPDHVNASLDLFRLRMMYSGSAQTTDCLKFGASAADVAAALNGFDALSGGVEVSRSGRGAHGDAFLYSIYFGTGYSGVGVGDVPQLELISSTCNRLWPVGFKQGHKDWGNRQQPGSNFTGLDIGVQTVVQGGVTERQEIALALDGGALSGAYFRLRYGRFTTPCLDWGADGAAVEAALNALPSLTDHKLDVTVDLRPINRDADDPPNHYAGTLLFASNASRFWRRDEFDDHVDRRPRFDGKVFPGDRVRVNGTDGVFTVAEVLYQGLALRLTEDISAKVHFSVDDVELFKVERAVSVRKSGLGVATLGRTEVQVVADDVYYADANTEGLFKLRVTHEGEFRETACIAYGAPAAAVEAAFDALAFDFNNDGVANDAGHVAVAREGDGEGRYGHGYAYVFTFRGPDNTRAASGYGGATSSVLGANAPQIEVVAVGSEAGCQDAAGPEQLLAATATTVHNSTTVELSADVAKFLAPGDRVRIGGSVDAFRLYTVAATATHGTAAQLELERAVDCDATGGVIRPSDGCGAGKKLWKSLAGAPAFAVKTVTRGRDVYAYEVAFVGPHLANADQLEIVDEASGQCAASWAHVGGRARDARVTTTREGGSRSVQLLTLAAEAETDKPATGRYFSLFLNHLTHVTANTVGAQQNYYGGSCFEWGVPAEVLEERIQDALNMTYRNLTVAHPQITVARSGFGDGSTAWGYTYELDYVGDLMSGDLPAVFAVHNGMTLQEKTVYYNARGNAAGLDDAEFEVYDSSRVPAVATYLLEITAPAVYDVNGTLLKNDTYVFSRMVEGEGRKTYAAQPARTAWVPIERSERPLQPGVFDEDGVYFRFRSGVGHAVGDTWVVQLYACGDTLKPGASVVGSMKARGGADPLELTLGSKVLLEGEGHADGFLVPQYFAVREPEVAVQTITVKDADGGGWAKGGTPAYRVSIGAAGLGARAQREPPYGNTSACLAWNARDADVELELNYLIEHHLGVAGATTVTRSTDAVEAPNGFVYSIYFDGLVGVMDAPRVEVNMSDCASPWSRNFAMDRAGDGAETVSTAVVRAGAGHRTDAFLPAQLPLGRPDDAFRPGAFRGANGTELGVYKVSGFYVSVAFDEALGDQPPMSVDATQLADGVRATVVDDVVQGSAATGITLGGLKTGVPYSVRVAARNALGYGNFSAPAAVGAPAAPPPKLVGLALATAEHADEVQALTLAATHVDEVQVFTATADEIFETQEVTIEAAYGQVVAGNFSVYFPDADVVAFEALATVTRGAWALNLTLPRANNDKGPMIYDNFTTACIPWNAPAEDVAAAIVATGFAASADDVAVARSGTGAASSNYGYSWTISYDGFQGKIPPPRAHLCAAEVYGYAGKAAGANVTVAPAPDRYGVRGLGTHTAKATIVVGATARIVEGAFRVTVDRGGPNTGGRFARNSTCLAWDASAEDVQEALISMRMFDSVRVVRRGDASAASHYGYAFDVYFDGYGLRAGPPDRYGLNASYVEVGAVTGDTACTDLFATEVYGVLTPFGWRDGVDAFLNVTNPDRGGFDLRAADDSPVTVRQLKREFEKLPVIGDVQVAVEITDTGKGLTWTLTYRDPPGDLPTLACRGDAAFVASAASCAVSTVIDGNSIAGAMTVAASQPIASDASAAQFAAALSLTDAGSVAVTRSGPDAQDGYAWTVTFLDRAGDVPPLEVVSSLTGSGAAVAVTTVRDGNVLGGEYSLETVDGYSTTTLPHDAAAADVAAALEAIGAVGSVEVSDRDDASSEGGKSFLITFTTARGDVPELRPVGARLTGAGAAVHVAEVLKGSEARGDAISISYDVPRECSESQVTRGACGASVDKVELQTSSTASFEADVTEYDMPADYTRQMVRIASGAFEARGFETPAVAGHFRLGYGGATTPLLGADATARAVRHALEALPGVGALAVERTYAARVDALATCRGETGHPVLTCPGLTAEDAPQASDLITVGGAWYSVADSYDAAGAPTALHLAEAHSSAVDTSYQGASGDELAVRGWAGGYEYEVRFLGNGAPRPISSPEHALVPVDASVGVRPAGCAACLYATGFPSFGTVYVRGRAVNALGPGPWSDVAEATPQRVPDAVGSFSLEVLSGSEIRVFWSPPPTASGTIVGYTLHWDTADTFDAAEGDAAHCDTAEFGSCLIQGAPIAGTPPYDSVVARLVVNTTYYFRIAARNELYDPLAEVDTVRWSETISGVTADQVPLAPTGARLALAGRDKLQLRFALPVSDGGSNLTHFLVEYDTSLSFGTNLRRVNVTAAAAAENVLHEGGPAVTYLTGLESGVVYYARVAAVNEVGPSPWGVAADPTAPAAAPDACDALAVSTALTRSGAPITELDVSWLAPGNATNSSLAGDNGSPITGYLVEWFTAETVCEEQQIRATWAAGTTPDSESGFVVQFSNGRSATTHGVTTAKLNYNAAASRLRSALVNLGHATDAPFDHEYVAGDVRVTRASTNNYHGYAWTVTFADCAPGGLNEGDLVPINIPEASVGDDLEVEVSEVRPGARSGGRAEVQVLRIYGDVDASTNETQPVRGFFRLGFDGSAYSPYVSARATAAELAEALELLPTVKQVAVAERPYAPSAGERGVEYSITFATHVGDQPTLFKDAQYLYHPALGGAADSSITGAENAVDDVTGLKADDSVVGEAPARYGSALVDADALAYTITDLEPGVAYSVRVAAVNAFGAGPARTAAPTEVPQQIADPPTDVSVGVNPGDADSLTVSFGEPESDGGATVTHYRVELDPTDTFDDPIREDFYCPTANKPTVWKVASEGVGATSPIVGGTFQLQVSKAAVAYTTDPIPYDAVALSSDEIYASERLCTAGSLECRTFSVANNSARVTASGSLAGILFDGDLVTFAEQKWGGQVYRAKFPTQWMQGGAIDAESAWFNLTDRDTGKDVPFIGTTKGNAALTRVHGGRGTETTSEIFCETDGGYCAPGGRLGASGSVEAKLEALDELLDLGVDVARYGPDDAGGYEWYVTFLDAAPESAANDFVVSINDNSLRDANGTVGSSGGRYAPRLTATLVQSGDTYASCTGTTLVVPSDGSGLVNGQQYYARVTAVNSVGYSLPQAAGAPSKPMTTPGPPTSVVLSTVSASQLRTQFSSPTWDGGDEITSYKVEYATSASFLGEVKSVAVTYLDGGSPFYKTVSGLDKGQRYYVRVSACNGQGCGTPQGSAPSSAAPYEESGAPSNVVLGVTSDSMLTLGYGYPEDDGGDSITAYRVEWDTSSSFNSLSASPHKGTVDVDATVALSYTIDELSPSTTYYVKVSAINAAGYGAPSATLSAAPDLVIPGAPRSLSAAPGGEGEVDVAWLYPRVPHHGIPCAAFAANPSECPVALGGALPESTGGAALLEYEITASESPLFDGTDTHTVTTSSTSVTVSGLTPDRRYYVRVAARNSVGTSAFCENEGTTCTGAQLSAVAPAG